MTISYDHRGLPVEFKREVSSVETGADSVRLVLNYDGAGSRISKIRERKSASETEWTTELATHYTGIGSEIREDALNNATKVVVNLPQGLGRYDIASASESSANTVPSFEWYLKNHLGSTMLVYGTQSTSDPTVSNLGSLKAAYDYRAFGEQVDLTMPTDKVTETFTGKEKDDETELSYFGARYLDQMLGVWIAVDPYREFYHSYAYSPANPINGFDNDGRIWKTVNGYYTNKTMNVLYNAVAIQSKGQSVMGRKTIGPEISNTKDIRVKHIVQEWQYDPNASDEVNGRYPFGTKRTVEQVKMPIDFVIQQFKQDYNVSGSVLYDLSKQEDWTPTVFDNSYKEFDDAILDRSNTYEPDGNVTTGDMICENCLD